MSPKAVTITDVARRARVSISTVSRVINNTVPVSAELRARVEQAMQELNYKPNILARNLRRQSSAMIGVIIPNIRGPFFAETVRGIEDFCFERGYMVYLCNSDDDPEKEILYAEQLHRMRVDGVIFVGTWGWELLDHVRGLCEGGIPVCLINRPAEDLPVDLVLIDKNRGNYIATSHLVAQGHQVIGCITHIFQGGVGHEEVRGYRKALEEAGIPVREDLIIEATPFLSGGYQAARSLLEKPDPPTAIFAHSDMLAIGAARAALEMGLHVPGDLSIVGFGDIPFSEFYNPPLTTVRQPQHQMGSKAAAMLFERMKNKQLPQRQAIVEPRLIIRATTAAPKQRNPNPHSTPSRQRS